MYTFLVRWSVFGLFFFHFDSFSNTFPLPEAYIEKARMPMHLVYPRPDASTQSHARHRWAHSDMVYQIPIGVQGGAWPFKYELIKAPAGASIGELYGQESYGIVNWKPQSGDGDTTIEFYVRVTDQELNYVDVEWTVDVDDSQFVFIQSGAKDGGSGAIDSPLADVRNWYKGSAKDDTFHNKIVVFREGMYELIGGTDTNYNVRLNADAKTPSLIAFPGEKAVIDASKAKIVTDPNTLKDIFIASLHWRGSRQDVDNAHFFWAIGDVSRSTWWNNTFESHGPGIKGNDNPAGVFISSPRVHKNYILYKGNIHDNFNNGLTNGSYVDIYYSSYVLVEENTARNSSNGYGYGLWAKATSDHVTIRANDISENIESGGISIGYSATSPIVANSHEVNWNKVRFLPNNARFTTLLFAGSKSLEGRTYNSFIYRNSFINGSAWVRFPGRENYKVSGNVVISNNLTRWNETIMDIDKANLVGGESSNIVDDNGELKAEYSDENFGIIGHNVFMVDNGDPPDSTVKKVEAITSCP